MSNSVSRREVLSLSLAAFATLKPEPSRPIPSEFPGKPKFWFGDVIRYPWFYADENKIHWETGKVMGVAWHSDEERWLYIINWTGSTCDRTGFKFPSFDEVLTDGDDFELVKGIG